MGILSEGFDNTFTNIRLAKVFIGVKLDSSGNMLRNIHPLYIYGNADADEMYSESIGFLNCRGNNFYDYCYSDQQATGFYIKGDAGGCGVIENLRVNKECEEDITYKKYITGKVLRYIR